MHSIFGGKSDSDIFMGRKIYFAGSIRGGRVDADLYGRIIRYIQKTDIVLTEHVGDPTLTDKGGDGGSAYIWQRDTAWLRECDLVIAECTQPSLGVGYELAFARFLQKPVYIFYGGEEGRLSAMLAGDPEFHIFEYSDEETMLRKMTEIAASYR